MTETLNRAIVATIVVCAIFGALTLFARFLVAAITDWQTFRRLQRSRGAFSLRRLKGGRR